MFANQTVFGECSRREGLWANTVGGKAVLTLEGQRLSGAVSHSYQESRACN